MIPEPPWWAWMVIGGIVSAWIVVQALIWLGEHIRVMLQ
jgi:hypothetical protein